MSLMIGQRATATRIFTAQDLAEYRALTGDPNPLHHEDLLARRLGYRGAVIPGMLLGGMVSCLLGVELPGRGTNWMKQSFQWKGPAYVGESIVATVEVVRLRPEKDLVNLKVSLFAGERLVGEGESLVMAREMLKPTDGRAPLPG
jgi:3-hydroxybutyryl-CoA dehydratase